MTDVYYVFNEIGRNGEKCAQETLLRADAISFATIETDGALMFKTHNGCAYKVATSWEKFEKAQEAFLEGPSSHFAPLVMMRVTDQYIVPAGEVLSACPAPGRESTGSILYLDRGQLRVEKALPDGRDGAKQTEILVRPLSQLIQFDTLPVQDIKAGLVRARARLVPLG